jgi:hypothetical protein
MSLIFVFHVNAKIGHNMIDNFDFWVDMVYGQTMKIKKEINAYQTAVKTYYEDKSIINKKRVEEAGAKLIDQGIIK